MEDKNLLLLVAMILLCILEIAALIMGINGQLFAGVIATIAAIAGYTGKTLLVAKSK